MEPLSVRSFPRAILHVDGDSFFASCEQMQDPSLRGKPVVTGLERGIASSMSYEAKARGVTRAMSLKDIRRLCPDAIILPSDYELYSLMSLRMYEIVRRYSDAVEEYSIDECFADLTGMRRSLHMSYIQIAEAIKVDLETELGVTFSIGLAPTKVLAKVASKWNKPSGLTVIPGREAHTFLAQLPVGDVWGIGPQTASYLTKKGVVTALDFAHVDESTIKQSLSKPFRAIWYELHAQMVYPIETQKKVAYKSLSKTKTFTPPSTDPAYVFAQLSKNIENACIKARRYKQASRYIYAFLKTQDFRYQSMQITLAKPTALPHVIVQACRNPFEEIFRSKTQYRGTGVVLAELEPALAQLDLFGETEAQAQTYKIFEHLDAMNEKYGKHAVFLGSSFLAHSKGSHQGIRGVAPKRQRALLKGETRRRRIGIPLIGEVS
ncbi:MAG: DNA polymerase IV [Candidatus Pacebacteria bacterium]|nr:DNA polymerase IV [Candidatus Paceibacterota bacterium]